MKPSAFLRKEWPALLLLAAPFVVILFVWDRVPDRIPTHWNLAGEADGYSGKATGLLLLPLLGIATYLLYWIAPKIDPKRRIDAGRKPLPALRFFTVVFFLVLFLGIVGSALGLSFLDTARMVPLGILLLFLVLGNYITTVQHNYFIGIRTPWTLEDEEVWRKTHRMGGRLWVGVSIVLLILWMLLSASAFRPLFIAGMVTMVLVPVVYSYYLYAAKERGA